MQTQNLTLQLCTVEMVKKLIDGNAAFEDAFGIRVMDGYLEFDSVLPYILLQQQTEPSKWGSYLFIHSADKALIGLGGYKGGPNADGMVEIGYGIAPAYRNRGYATEAAQGMIDYAFADPNVRRVWAHTLAEPNASTHVLQKCGMSKIAELDDPDDGRLWRWELVRKQER